MDAYASDDDLVLQDGTRKPTDDYDSYSRSRLRTDPVRDIIVAQAEARQQQQQQQQQQQHLIELSLPLSGAAIIPSSLDRHDNTPLTVTLPPAPRTTSGSGTLSRTITPPLLSTFQVSRAGSPSTSTNASMFEEMHSADAEFSESATADQVPRGKRSRPTPHQLATLRGLHAITSSPTIEERTRVGREIGM